MSQLFSRHFLFFVNFFFVVVAPKHIYIYFDIDADVPQMLVDVAYIFHVLLLMVVIDGTDRPGKNKTRHSNLPSILSSSQHDSFVHTSTSYEY